MRQRAGFRFATGLALVASVLAGCADLGTRFAVADDEGSKARPSSNESLPGYQAPDAAASSGPAAPSVESPALRPASPLCGRSEGIAECASPDFDLACANLGADAGESAPDSGAGKPTSAVRACRVSKQDGGAQVPVCTRAGSGVDRAPCKTGEDCAAGLECVGTPGQCRHYCCDTSCADLNHFCDPRPTAHDPSLVVPVCVPFESCRLLEDSCNDGQETCAVVNEESGSTGCVKVGAGRAGESCETERCARGLTCLGVSGDRRCRKLCHITSVTNECAAGEACRTNSATFRSSNSGIGICVRQ